MIVIIIVCHTNEFYLKLFTLFKYHCHETADLPFIIAKVNAKKVLDLKFKVTKSCHEFKF